MSLELVLHYWSCVSWIYRLSVDSPHQRLAVPSFDVSFDASLSKQKLFRNNRVACDLRRNGPHVAWQKCAYDIVEALNIFNHILIGVSEDISIIL